MPYYQSVLKGPFTYGYQFTLTNTHWAEFSSMLGTTDILSDPQFQLQPRDPWQPLQTQVNFNLLNQTWPRLGPLIASTALQAGWQWTQGQGNVLPLVGQIDLSLAFIEWLHIQGSVQLNNTFDPAGNLHSTVQIPFTILGARVRW